MLRRPRTPVRHRPLLTLGPTLILALAGCEPQEASPPYAPCEGTTRWLWSPGAAELQAWPDAAYQVDDPTSPTGLRIDLSAARAPWRADLPELLAPLFDAVSEVSGFGRQGEIILRFDAPLTPPDVDATGLVVDPDLELVALTDAGPASVPLGAVLEDEGRQLRLQPLRPLAPATEHLVVLTRDHLADDGRCVAPSEALQAELTRPTALGEGHLRALGQIGRDRSEVSALLRFTTHDDLGAVVDAARDLQGATHTLEGDAACESGEDYRHCAREVVTQDYRGPRGFVEDGAPSGPWTLPVDVYLPPSGEGPWPVVLFGHGLNSSRGEARRVAEELAPRGFAVVGVDALQHGDHPTNQGATDDLSGVRFLGLDLAGTFSLDPLVLRGNFDQTVLDRLQVLQALRQIPDVDGDGTDDLDGRTAYLGISLGGLLGQSLLSLDPELAAAALPVGGGHLSVFVTDTEATAILQPLLRDLLGGEAGLTRMLAVVQTGLDPSDPAVWATHVQRDRLLHPDHLPHVVLPVAQFDEIVPPPTGRALARGLGLAHLDPVIDPVPPLVPAGGPLSGNRDGVTSVFVQLDRVTHDGTVQPADHGRTPFSPEGRAVWVPFFETWDATGVPTVSDPYAATGTPAL